MDILELNYLDVEENKEYENLILLVLKECFKTEGIENKNLYVNVVLTDSKNIKTINREHRGIDKETDVLSFPMYERGEVKKLKLEQEDILGDMVISLEKVRENAEEYGHGFKRELAYMVVHSFYHLMGYDHIEDMDKQEMRQKEEFILNKLNITR